MKYKFGPRSQKHLDACHPLLQKVLTRTLNFGVMDFSVIEGHRTIERQQELYAEGKSQIDGVTKRGKHNALPSRAVDIIPYPPTVNGVNVWKDSGRFHVLAGLVYAAAALEGVNIRWGGDWDGDGNNADSSFHDLPHFELLDS
ncbi:M15 family metallopeptidase [Zhongshania sp.]|uniref:M15 family metallopeptidase n=1 Tax=Zhongshania sp. TaxID=1971902 RepID=UPI0035668434